MLTSFASKSPPPQEPYPTLKKSQCRIRGMRTTNQASTNMWRAYKSNTNQAVYLFSSSINVTCQCIFRVYKSFVALTYSFYSCFNMSMMIAMTLVTRYCRSLVNLAAQIYKFLLSRGKPFWIQLCYFILLSCLGYLLFKCLDSKDPSIKSKDLDLFFMSVSSATLATMSTIEMEAFSNSQLIVITALMLLGGEVFVSMLGLQFSKCKLRRSQKEVTNSTRMINFATPHEVVSDAGDDKYRLAELESNSIDGTNSTMADNNIVGDCCEVEVSRYQCVKYLSHVVMFYLLVVHLCGCFLILLYIKIDSTTNKVLKSRRLSPPTFAVFTTVSAFSNAGFIPTNENMVAFRREPGLLLLIVPLILMGNCLFPICLRLALWGSWKVTRWPEAGTMLKSPAEVGYDHLLPPAHCWMLFPTVVGLIVLQVIIFCCMEWRTAAMRGMNAYEKAVGALFMATNSRHGGEAVVDVGALTPAVVVMFVVMMYLPPYTSFVPDRNEKGCSQRRLSLVQIAVLSQLTYLAICVVLICIIENKNVLEDPVNFSVLNIIVEVISAYGTVGYTTGYSCQRRLNQEEYCKDSNYGFAGRWSNKGKMVLIFVMFLGRLKMFNMHGGKAWKLQ